MNRANAGGVAIPMTVMDEFVVMRLAQLIESGTVGDAVDRALRHGNLGGNALAAHAEVVRNAFRPGATRNEPRENREMRQ